MTSALEKLFNLTDRTAVVTGAAAGIGKAASALLAEAGAHVVIVDRDRKHAEEAAQEIGHKAFALNGDIADEAAMEKLFGDVIAREKRIHILVNNAGIAIRRPAVELSLEDWNKVLSVNMTGVFLCSRIAARYMIAAGQGGAIVNTASIMGLSGGGLYPNISYQATKGAVVNMTRALAVEWAGHNIRVNAVAPTYVRTNLIKPILEQPELVAKIEAMTPLRRLATPEEVAAAILFLASPAASMVTGHTLAVDGGFLAQ
ncbi:MAG: SDR family NAD(P)-dependent oxidoreductase [Parvibaculaceae bacterium]